MIDEVRTVCFVGAGTMGCYNSLISALAGYNVMLYDIAESALESAPERHHDWGRKLIETARNTEQEVETALGRITHTTDAAAAAGESDLLSESVLEQLELKRQTHGKFDRLLPPHAIMTTNTSSLLLSDIEDIDRCWTLIHGQEIGPFATIDLIGLDAVKERLLARADAFEELLGYPGRIKAETERAVKLLDTHIKKGELGKKSGRGFYQYKEKNRP